MQILQVPDGYHEVRCIDLQHNKKLAWLLNIAALLIAVLMAVPALLLVPFSVSFSGDSNQLLMTLIKTLLLIPSLIAYMVLHELVHGLFIKILSGVKPFYGFTGLYAFAGSNAFLGKRDYLIVALSPIVLFGLLFLLLNAILPLDWFWFIYTLQIINISGAAGDAYITGVMCRMPADVLTRDIGAAMFIYSKEKI